MYSIKNEYINKISDPVQGGQKQEIINNILKDQFRNIFKRHQFLYIENTYFLIFIQHRKSGENILKKESYLQHHIRLL